MKSKLTSIIAGLMTAATLLSSCTSTSQTFAGLTGAAIGSNIGGAIGASSSSGYGRFRHYNGQGAALGSLIGAGVGAALGVAIQKSVEAGERRQQETTQDYSSSNSRDSYDYRDSYNSRSTSSYYNNPSTYSPSSSAANRLPVRISEITYFDGNGDGYMSKGETIEIGTYIQNVSDRTLYDIEIILDTQQSKYTTVSSPLTITLEPRQKVRYSGRIFCCKSKSGKSVPLALSITSGSRQAQSETIYLDMK